MLTNKEIFHNEVAALKRELGIYNPRVMMGAQVTITVEDIAGDGVMYRSDKTLQDANYVVMSNINRTNHPIDLVTAKYRRYQVGELSSSQLFFDF